MIIRCIKAFIACVLSIGIACGTASSQNSSNFNRRSDGGSLTLDFSEMQAPGFIMHIDGSVIQGRLEPVVRTIRSARVNMYSDTGMRTSLVDLPVVWRGSAESGRWKYDIMSMKTSAGIRSIVNRSDGSVFDVSLTEIDVNSPALTNYAITRISNHIMKFECGSNNQQIWREVSKQEDIGSSFMLTGGCELGSYSARIALDMDYPAYLASQRDHDSALEYATWQISLVDMKFGPALNMSHEIVHLNVYTADQSDPYRGRQGWGRDNGVREQLATNWPGEALRDGNLAFAFLLAGRPYQGNQVGGAAERGLAGARGTGYGYGRVDYRSAVIHEFGHLWGAGHCNDPDDDGVDVNSLPLPCFDCPPSSIMFTSGGSNDFAECSIQEMHSTINQALSAAILREPIVDNLVFSTPSGPIEPDGVIDMGKSLVDVSKHLTVSISNPSSCDIPVDVAIDGSDFQLVSQLPKMLPAGSSVDVEIAGSTTWPRETNGTFFLLIDGPEYLRTVRSVPVSLVGSIGDLHPSPFTLNNVTSRSASGPASNPRIPYGQNVIEATWSHSRAAERYDVYISNDLFTYKIAESDIDSLIFCACDLPGIGQYWISAVAVNANGVVTSINRQMFQITLSGQMDPCNNQGPGNSNCERPDGSNAIGVTRVLPDANGDGVVDVADLSIVIGDMGTTVTDSDVNKDGVVDRSDIQSILFHLVGNETN